MFQLPQKSETKYLQSFPYLSYPISFYLVSKGALLPQAPDLWPDLLFWGVFFFFLASAETSSRWSADATTRPCRQPDCHDAGHPGPRPVLLQRQADDRESPSPACTLKKTFTSWWKRMSDKTLEAECCFFLCQNFFKPQAMDRVGFISVFWRVIGYFLPSGLTFSCYKGTYLQHAPTLFWAIWRNGVKKKPEEWCLFKWELSAFEVYLVMK